MNAERGVAPSAAAYISKGEIPRALANPRTVRLPPPSALFLMLLTVALLKPAAFAKSTSVRR